MFRELTVAVVIPAYNEERLLPRTLAGIPSYVDKIYVADDASCDGTSAIAESWADPRVQLVSLAQNGGVGAAIVAGYKAALHDDFDAVVVMAADDQMDPADLSGLLDAFVDEGADYVKGDRIAYGGAWLSMPPHRLFGTSVLGYLTRLSSGLPGIRDSQCGYTVIGNTILRRLPLDELFPRYGFPNDLLNRVGEVGGVLAQRPVRPVYADETSGLRARRVVWPISRILLKGVGRRLRKGSVRWQMLPRVAQFFMFAGVLFAGLGLGVLSKVGSAQEATAPVLPPEASRFLEALELVEAHYYNPVDPQELVRAGAYGLVDTLDSNSQFLPPSDYQVWHAKIHGKSSGVGLHLQLTPKGFAVADTDTDSPAAKAGIVEGELLLAIDGDSIEGLGLQDLHDRLMGDVGTEVVLLLKAPLERKPREVALTREQIKVASVKGDLLKGKIAVLTVRSFQERATEESRRVLADLEERADGELRGIIVDVRDNLGGMLTESVDLADLFLPSGDLVVSLETRGEATAIHITKSAVEFPQPMVILVNHRSASASELFSAAMRDNERATIVGTTTYGKGSVQSTYPLGDGSGLKLTTAWYLTPNGAHIDKIGVVPDVFAESSEALEVGREELNKLIDAGK
ncbi:MAG: hypothetical protein AUK47_09985 [Deltaproteobacteria bacterium CG2_30_63_29]|nr:MAG: hypothetical protein AUK47_09985 [Deltaproteobacteria bacterium CG2_30_63_29]